MSTFTKRDLALYLPDTAGEVRSLSHQEEDDVKFEPLKPRIDTSKKVQRYFPGVAPQWSEEQEFESIQKSNSSEVVVDKRLARLSMASKPTSGDSSPPRAASGRRRVYEAEVVLESDDEDENEEDNLKDDGDDDEGAYFSGDDEKSKSARKLRNEETDIPVSSIRFNLGDDFESKDRNQLTEEEDILERRQRALQKKQEAAKKQEEEDEYEEIEVTDDDQDEDEDDEEEEFGTRKLKFKPVFVSKSNRNTLKNEEVLAEEEEEITLKKLAYKEKRIKQTKLMVAENLERLRKQEEKRKMLSDAGEGGGETDGEGNGMPDDGDEDDQELEYEKWKLREIKRLTRDAQIREKEEQEKKELERLRNLTEEERREEDRKLEELHNKEKEKEKPQWNFLQKYYHKGVFYMDEDSTNSPSASSASAISAVSSSSSSSSSIDVRKRDYSNAPTLEDKFNKELLPSVMQVKNFGKRGRTKYTHLADQDTTFIDRKIPLGGMPGGSILGVGGGVGIGIGGGGVVGGGEGEGKLESVGLGRASKTGNYNPDLVWSKKQLQQHIHPELALVSKGNGGGVDGGRVSSSSSSTLPLEMIVGPSAKASTKRQKIAGGGKGDALIWKMMDQSEREKLGKRESRRGQDEEDDED